MISEKVLTTLEFNKILANLARHAHFSASEELALSLKPTSIFDEAVRRMSETTEAATFLNENPRTTIGGARDIRSEASDAGRGGVLQPDRLLRVQSTLESSSRLKKMLIQQGVRFPILAMLADSLLDAPEIIASIANAIDEYGQVKDSASAELSSIRRRLAVESERLKSRLHSLLQSGAYASILQENIITVRGGRHVIPIKSESKGNIKGIIHDQSSSGATVYIEPLETVSINNEIRELEMKEAEEIQRILTELSLLIGSRAGEIIRTIESLAKLDFAFAKARFASEIDAEAPLLIDFGDADFSTPYIRLVRARHPLINPAQVVPIDVALEGEIFQLVITGPNTGGKTVTLKTVGLLTLMAQAGLHIPAYEESVITVFDSIFADIGDEQSIEQSLSTFSGHLANVTDILAHADNRSLALIDELGSGTDPVEGSAIARAVLTELLDKRVTTFVATHYPELKAFAQMTKGVSNASMEFDLEKLSPTYRLIVGLPGRSNALTIATRLGLPEPIINRARSFIQSNELKVDDLIDDLLELREEARLLTSNYLERERMIAEREKELELLLEKYEKDKDALIQQFEDEMRNNYSELSDEIAGIRKYIRSLSPTLQSQIGEIVEAMDEVSDEAEEVSLQIDTLFTREESTNSAYKEEKDHDLRPGDYVFVPSMNTTGQVLTITGGEAEIQVGVLRTRINAKSLEYRSKRQMKAEGKIEHEDRGSGGVTLPVQASPGLEVNLISKTVDEALPVMEDYIDRAYRAGLPWSRIVHGKGTGALRRAVQERLRKHPLVKEFRHPPENEGGSGVTLVYFKSSG